MTAGGETRTEVTPLAQQVPQQRLPRGVPTADVRALRRRLFAIEPMTRLDPPSVRAEAEAILVEARALESEPESLRAELVIADILHRAGDVAEAGRTAERIRAWADDNGDHYLHARACRVLGGHYFRLGDDANGLRSAVDCLRLLPPGTPDNVYLDHLLCVGDCLARAGSLGAATEEYRKALDVAYRLGDEEWLLVTLNNFLITLAEDGKYDEADVYVGHMLAIADEETLKLDYAYLDTFANIALGRGDFERLKELLSPVLAEGFEDVRNDPYGLGDCLVTFISACQEYGDLDLSWRGLQAARAIERRHGISLPEMPLLNLEASHASRVGDFELAYQLQRKAYDLMEASRADERDARSRLLHSVFATAQAKADSGKFQRLALLDPLTGLGNRRFVNETLPIRLQMHAAQHLAVGLIDLDHFKDINDRYSHAAGDVILQEFAACAAQWLGMDVCDADDPGIGESQWEVNIMKAYEDPSAPYVSRLGGEEFLMVMLVPGVELAVERCQLMLDQLRARIWGVPGLDRAITASIGLVFGAVGHSMPTILDAADELLYQAKDAGRDQIMWRASGRS